ncbi:MAG: hypothetical protein QXW39_07960 [Candidatus Bathyarchaeia archaeon]
MQDVREKEELLNDLGTREGIDHFYGWQTLLFYTGKEHLKTGKLADVLFKSNKKWVFRFVLDLGVRTTT